MSSSKIAEKATCWFIFTVDNNYDQPPNNLLWWSYTKPSIDELSKAVMNRPLADLDDKYIIHIVNMFRGEEVRIDETTYRMREMTSGLIE